MPGWLPGDPGLVSREVRLVERKGKPAYAVVVSRGYDTDIEDLWDALSDPARLRRWFLPVTGELREGGRYQFEGNAGGTITRCDPPRQVDATWEYGGQTSWVAVTLEALGEDAARMTLEHVAHVPAEFWDQYGPGATGVGWDLGFQALAAHVQNPERAIQGEEPATSAAGRAFIAAASVHWARASIALGTDPAKAHAAADRTTAFFSGTG